MTAIDDAKRRYDFESWADRNRLDRELFVSNLFIPRTRLGDATLLSSRRLPAGLQAFSSMWALPGIDDTPTELRIDVVEETSRQAAHEMVATTLTNFESPLVAAVPAARFGDVGFSAPEGGAVVFARANVAVVLANAGMAPCDVAGVAQSIDEWLIEMQPAEATEAQVAAAETPGVRVRVPERGRVGRIDLTIPDALTTYGPPMLKLTTRRGSLYGTSSGLRIRPTDAADDSRVDGYLYERSATGAGRRIPLRRLT